MGLYRRGRIWWLAYTLPSGGQRFESSRSTNKRFAKKLLNIRLAEIAEGRYRLPKSNPPRLREYAAEFLNSIHHQNTRRRYRSSVRCLVDYFRDARLPQVTADRIEEFKQDRLASGVRSATVNRDLAVLRRMMKLAVRRRLVTFSPFDEVEFLEEKKQRRQPHILSFAEQERLLAMASPLIRVLVVLLTETGLRVNSEALPLRWSDIDFTGDTIQVCVSKTSAGRRTVPLSSYCREELLRWRELSSSESSPYVFPNPRSSTGHLRVVRKMWGTALRLAGIEYFPVYNLRHTFASRLSAAGASDVFVAQMMGHATPSILQTYSRAIGEHRRDAIRRLEALRASYTSKMASRQESVVPRVN